ncbi:hypothetical protein OUO_0817 [Helicobacter pylori R046Wa]|nr:hypothetical protein OUO_0817 [Helicobacter pylori R046Wa]
MDKKRLEKSKKNKEQEKYFLISKTLAPKDIKIKIQKRHI